MNLSLRIYKNEYQASHLNYIKSVFDVTKESEKTIEIVGEETLLAKVQLGMFATDEQFKNIFPDYVTVLERQAITNKELEDLKDQIATTLCR